MRKIARFILLSLVVVPVAYWILGGALLSVAQPQQAGDSSLCERVDWYLAPVALGRQEWVASMEGNQDDPRVIEWKSMTDAERGALLARCGKERP